MLRDKEPTRTPRKHEVQCKSCQHPDLDEVEALWSSWRLSDASAAEWIGCSERAWRRHATYTDLYRRRAQNSGALCQRIIELGLRAGEEGRATLGDALRAMQFLRDNVPDRPTITLEDVRRLKLEIETAVKEGRVPAEVLDGGQP